MHLIEGETLQSKYDINELEFLREEFRYGTTVKNGARECIGGPPRHCSYCYGIGAGEGYAGRRAILRV